MKKLVKPTFAMIIATAFVFLGCKHSSSEPGITGSWVFIAGRTVEIIPTLWMCDHEVTQAEYTAIMGANPSFLMMTQQTGRHRGTVR